MSDIAKDILSTTDKLNFISSTNNLTKFVSNFETFANENETEEERLERLCKTVIIIRVLYLLTIFVALYIANSNGIISNELFMGLSLLSLAMPDIVLIILIIVSVAGSSSSGSDNTSSATSDAPVPVGSFGKPPSYSRQSTTSSEGNLKYNLTQTPDVFMN